MKLFPRWWQPAVLGLATALLFVPAAQAEAPQQKTQVPGYYRHMVGGFEVTALYDGQIELDTKILKQTPTEQIQRLLADMFRNNPTPTAVNTFLVNTGSQLVLIDTGAGRMFGNSLGNVVANLRAAGYAPEQVDAVLLTHLHGDHVGGAVDAEGKAVFPNAQLFVAKKEADYWLSQETMAKAPQEVQGFFKMAQNAVAPYVASGKLKTFEGEQELLPGIRPVNTRGHTPGHTSYLFESGGRSLLVWGDIVHNAYVQFPRPDTTIEFDIDQKAAAATRKRLFENAARQKLTVTGMHLPFPGIGNVRSEGKAGYRWVPIDYGPVR
ncbi:MBL fold metallo-hydrolase [Aquabacterium sp. A7-Y]|uniref:MBL fold metallo-hydrolase n=1 Tax=Aquabacterium sp. A7-Y TaxID=1349605 RepID=UPI00223C9CF1|nr:MBL fold metallo-hydrolase [Aquabacterium sp. A7-Y]MCW7539280.1 MBL fold metallo-hydrolase [Aquabacterium sp. A7-Y]